MPRKLIVGKNKHGNPKELAIPHEIYGPRGEIAWKEHEIKNRYRNSKPTQLLDSKGRVQHNGHNIIYDHSGKIVGGTLTTHITKGELSRLLATHRAKQKKVGWQTNMLRRAGITLRQIERMKHGQEVDAIKFLLRDGFFGTAIMTGKIIIPEDKTFSMQKIKDLAADYFLDAYMQEKKSRKKGFLDSARKMAKHAKDVVLK